MPTSPEALADRLDIDDLLTRYATAVDRRDWDLWETCFTDDAFIDYSAFGGTKGGRGEIRAWLEKTLAMFDMSQHLVVNREVAIEGDRATCRSAFYNPMALQTGDEEGRILFFEGGYYCDQMVRTEGGWKIRERVEEYSYSTRLDRTLRARKPSEQQA